MLTADEIALLEALFGARAHAPAGVRRFSADRRALAGRLKRSLVQHAEHALARDGLVAPSRVTWPGMTLTVLAYLGMLVEALFLVFALIDGDWPALIATLVALAATIATILVTPRVVAPIPAAARGARREHLDGLRQYLALAEADRLRMLQSPSGADLRATAPRRERRPRAAPERRCRRSPASTCTSGCSPTPCSSASSASGSRSSSSSTPRSTAANLDTLADLIDATAEIGERPRRRGQRASSSRPPSATSSTRAARCSTASAASSRC